MVRFSGRALTVFVGGLGLGWVWKIPAFLCIVGGLGFTVHWLRGPVTLPFPMPPVFFLSAEAMALAIVLVATGIMARIDGCYLFSYGLDGRSIARKLIAGWIGGLAAISSLLGLLASTGQMRIAGLSLHEPRLLGLGVLWAVLFLVQSMTEETLFRGYVQATLARGIGFWPAAFGVSLLFALGHFMHSGQTAILASTAGVAGLMFCLLLRMSGSLWLGIGFHAAWNWGESFLYGTADSGLVIRDHLMTATALGSLGSVGPEGSLAAPPALILGTLGLLAARGTTGVLAPMVRRRQD